MSLRQRASALAVRRELLVTQADQQRRELAAVTRPLARRLAWVDEGLALARWARDHPLWLAGAALAVAIWRPTRALRFAGLGLALWRATGFLRVR